MLSKSQCLVGPTLALLMQGRLSNFLYSAREDVVTPHDVWRSPVGNQKNDYLAVKLLLSIIAVTSDMTSILCCRNGSIKS